jgi:uncharacterized protein YabN with tetrapyrrole methylase and pyrophosphatase domain
VGFDWPDIAGVLAKVDEELSELREAIRAGTRGEIEAELGDVLLSLASLGRHLRTPAEDALRGAIHRFDARFRQMEAQAARAGQPLDERSADELESMWRNAKRALAGSDGAE